LQAHFGIDHAGCPLQKEGIGCLRAIRDIDTANRGVGIALEGGGAGGSSGVRASIEITGTIVANQATEIAGVLHVFHNRRIHSGSHIGGYFHVLLEIAAKMSPFFHIDARTLLTLSSDATRRGQDTDVIVTTGRGRIIDWILVFQQSFILWIAFYNLLEVLEFADNR
jgi:hypothetical protein